MNAQATAYSFLKEQILAGKMPAGTSIKPAEIGNKLGLSRMPVRDAIVQLEAEGLITFGANRRPVVTTLTVKEILERFEIRIALEALAIERAVTRLTPEMFDELELQIIRMERSSSDTKRWLLLHDEFHDMIYQHAEMPRLSEEIHRIRQSVRPYLLMYIDLYQGPEMPGVEHSSLLQVLRAGDPAAARSALTEHIRHAGAGVVYFLMNGQMTPFPSAKKKSTEQTKVGS
jgi:DNA-binding GntR family transcriptional regulator